MYHRVTFQFVVRPSQYYWARSVVLVRWKFAAGEVYFSSSKAVTPGHRVELQLSQNQSALLTRVHHLYKFGNIESESFLFDFSFGHDPPL